MRRFALVVAASLAVAFSAFVSQAFAQDDTTPPLPHPGWSFDGPFGTYDRAALQRGLQVYTEVCSNCHSMNLVTYDDLGTDGPGGGLGYTEDQVKAIAAQKQVTDGPNDQGDMFQRPARPADHFVPPFPNDNANRAAHNGALPPDLSLIVKERASGIGAFPWDDSGADYVFGILTGFQNSPPNEKMPDNSYYNVDFPGHHIAMPPPLSDDIVTYSDGTKATVAQEAHDVVTFLTWAAEPNYEERKHTGAKVIIFLLVMTGILYAAKRKIWAGVH